MLSISQSVDFYSGLSGATNARTTCWMMSGYDCLNKKLFNNSQRKMDSELAATTSVGSGFQLSCRLGRMKWVDRADANYPMVDQLSRGKLSSGTSVFVCY